ncbi:unnamed protein product, partial [Brassica rapa]
MKIGSINVVLGLLEDQIDEEIGSYGSPDKFGLKSRAEIMFFGQKWIGSDWILLMKTNHGALTFEGNISVTAMEGLGGTDVASVIEGVRVGEEDPKALEEKLLPDSHGADKQKDLNKEENEGEKIEEMEGLSEETYSELTGDAALSEAGEQDGSEHVGDEVFAEADFDVEEDDQLMETETQECNGMFLFWTRHFAITMFIDIIKEHQLLQLVMKHLNWCNGYWLVLSCIKNRFSPVEYQVVCFLWLSMVVLWRRDLKNLQMQIRC